MSFDSGSVSFRMLQAKLNVPDLVDRAGLQILPSMDDIRDPVYGFAGPSHLLDRDVSFDRCFYGGLLRLSLVKAERRFPAKRLKAEIAREIAAAQKERGFVSKRDRAEIKESVQSRLFPEAPAALDGIELVFDEKSGVLLTDALSDSKLDALYMMIRKVDKSATMVTVNADRAAQSAGVNVNDLKPMRVKICGQEELFAFRFGREFLTWLLWTAETVREIDVDGQPVAVAVDGPLTLAGESGAVSSVVVKGETPTLSTACHDALESGKLLKRARVTLACGEDVYSFNVDADDWTFRGVKVPKDDVLKGIDLFSDRMVHLERLRMWWLGAFTLFLKMRRDVPDGLNDKSVDWMMNRSVFRRR